MKQGNIYYTDKDFTDLEVSTTFKYPCMIILKNAENEIEKITTYNENGIKSIYDFSLSASKQFVTDSIATAIATKQDNLGYTPENVANKSDSYTSSSSTTYASTKALVDGLAIKQNILTNPITGTGTANYIPKFSGTGTITNSIVYETNNKIGVNTTPSDTLDVKTVGQGSIRLGGVNGRTISAYNSTGTSMNIDFSSGATFLGNLYGSNIFDFATNKQSVRLSSTNITFWSNSIQRLTLDINGNLSDSAGKFKSQRTITITGDITLSETHNGAVLNVTNTCNITIPTGLDANFQCVIFAKGSIIVTFVNGGVTVYAPSGLLLKTDKMASLISTSANNFNLTGELATS